MIRSSSAGCTVTNPTTPRRSWIARPANGARSARPPGRIVAEYQALRAADSTRPISPHPETAPAWSIVRYDFEARGSRPPVKLLWYDGGKLPPLELFDGHAPRRTPAAVSSWAKRAGWSRARGDGATGCFPNASSPAMPSPSPRSRALPATMPSGSRPARRKNPRVRTLIIPPG